MGARNTHVWQTWGKERCVDKGRSLVPAGLECELCSCNPGTDWLRTLHFNRTFTDDSCIKGQPYSCHRVTSSLLPTPQLPGHKRIKEGRPDRSLWKDSYCWPRKIPTSNKGESWSGAGVSGLQLTSQIRDFELFFMLCFLLSKHPDDIYSLRAQY